MKLWPTAPLGAVGLLYRIVLNLKDYFLSLTAMGRTPLVIFVLLVSPAPPAIVSAHSQIGLSRGYGSDSGHPPFTSIDSYKLHSTHISGRLTKPYPRGLH